MRDIYAIEMNVINIRCLESQVAQVPVTEGYVIWCKDTGNVYFDADGERKSINDIKIKNAIASIHDRGESVGYTIEDSQNINVHGVEVLSEGHGEIFNDYAPRTYEVDGVTAKSGNTATGKYSHAEGHLTDAKGRFSHTEGLGTIASRDSQHVGGQYNRENTDCLFIIGNGADEENRSNALELYANGDLKINGRLTDNNNNSFESVLEAIEQATENMYIYQYR